MLFKHETKDSIIEKDIKVVKNNNYETHFNHFLQR